MTVMVNRCVCFAGEIKRLLKVNRWKKDQRRISCRGQTGEVAGGVMPCQVISCTVGIKSTIELLQDRKAFILFKDSHFSSYL